MARPSGMLRACVVLGLAIHSPSLRAAQHDEVTATITTRIGATLGAGPEVFGRVEALELDEAGRVYVLDGMDQQVRVFDANGKFVRSLGRKGAGPGEFRSAVGLAWAPDGSLWIPDPENSRVSVFDTSGSFVNSHVLRSDFTLAPWPGRFDQQGNFYHYASSPVSEWRYVMVRYSAGLIPGDTLAVPRPPSDPEYFEGREPRGGVVRALVPFTPRMVWRLSSQGEVWAAWTAEYSVFQVERAGGRTRIIEHETPRVPVTGAERDVAIAGLSKYAMVVDASRIPRHKPLIHTFVLDDRDRIWVVPYTSESGSQTPFDVFRADGNFLGRVVVPASIESVPTPIVRNWMIVGSMRDDLGTQFVIEARVRPLDERR